MPQLGRFHHTVQDTSGNALSGVSVNIYREGATVNGNQTGTSPFTVTVHDNGKIAAADTVFVNTTTGTTYAVNSVTDITVVLSGFLGGLSLTNGDRLVPINNDPSLYSDDQGGTEITNPLTSSSTGIASCFMGQGTYEVIVSGSGASTTLFQSQIIIDEPQITGYVNVKDYGAEGDNVTDDTESIQEAVDAAKVMGHLSRGATVLFPPGSYVISSPIILPRTGVTPVNVVQLQGVNIRSCRIVGSSSFPSGRGMIEWETSATRAWHQSIKNLTFALPNVNGTMAIYYLPTDVSTSAAMRNETLQIDLDNILLEGANQYHQRLIYLRGNLKLCDIRNIYGDCNLTNHTYDTIVLETDTSPASEGEDAAGFFSSGIHGLYGNMRRGGRHQNFKGRLVNSILDRSFCDGTNDSIDFEFVNCSSSTVRNTSTEGRGSKPTYKFNSCKNLLVENINVGTPTDSGDGIGNGIELVASTDCLFLNRWALNGQQSHAQLGVKFLTLDANSHRNKFLNFMLTTNSGIDPTTEFTDSGTENVIEYFRVTAGVPGNQYHRLSSEQILEVPSAATLTLGSSGGRDTFHNMFKVSGTTNITSISTGDTVKQRLITLIFTDAAPGDILHGNNIKLAGGITFSPAQYDAITLRCDGTDWFEASPR